MKQKKFINVIQLDSRDSRFQSGIARYFDVLGPNLPDHIKMMKIIFLHSPDIKDVRIVPTDKDVYIYHPDGYPAGVLYEAVITFIGARLNQMENIIVQCNCLGCEAFAYLLKSRFYLKIVGALHCLPHRALGSNGTFPPSNPFFNMDHVILVCDRGVEYLNGVKNKRPYTVIYNGIEKPKINSKKPKDGVFRFIFANGWARHKQFELIIPAIRMVAERYDIEILMLGGGTPDKNTTDAIANLPIKSLGLIENPNEIANWYEMADCALFSSASEACSFAGIEAMAYNLPIVSTNAAGLVEMFGNAALFVEMDDGYAINPDKYADAMMEMIKNKRLRAKLAILSYARYAERYTVKKMVRDTVELYESLV